MYVLLVCNDLLKSLIYCVLKEQSSMKMLLNLSQLILFIIFPLFPCLFDVLSSCCIPSLLCFFVFFFSLQLILQIFALSVLNSQISDCSECSLPCQSCPYYWCVFFLIIFFFFFCFCHVACFTGVLAFCKPIIWYSLFSLSFLLSVSYSDHLYSVLIKFLFSVSRSLVIMDCKL